MIIHNIEDLDLYTEKDGKRLKLHRDLKINEVAFIGNGCNKIKKISDCEYMFIRKDYIGTHIKNENKEYDLNLIYEKILKKLDYEIKYAEDRMELVKELLEEYEDWFTGLLSTNRMIAKEIKKKSDFLSEDQRYDKLIEQINNYITHAKFINKEDELKHQEILKEKKKLEQKGKRNKTKDDFDKLNELIDDIQNYHHKITKKKIDGEGSKVEYTGNLSKRERIGDFVYQEELKDRTKKAKFNYKKNEITHEYWKQMYPSQRKEIIPHYDYDLHVEDKNKSIKHYKFRPQILKQMKNELDKLRSELGLDIVNSEERKQYREVLKKKIGSHDYRVKRKIYTELKADYEIAKIILTDEITPRPDKHTTIYDINSDTWYENEDGEIIEISRNIVSLGDVNTYKGLILNYKDLRDKYEHNQQSDWWALIKDFEYILSKTDFTDDEKFVLEVLFDGYSQKQIREKYENVNLEKITKDRIHRMINVSIPKKLLNTHLDIIQDWLVINKQFGKYKVCSKCGESKLANERYFRFDRLAKDNLRNQCRKCESLAK